MPLPPHALARVLAGTAVFEGFSRDDLAALGAWMELMAVAEGDVIFEEGTEGSAWYVLLEGAVSIQRAMPTGPAHELGLLQAGECFGEMALLDGAPRMASAWAETDAVLARLDRARFDLLLDAGDELAIRLLRAMSRILCQRQRELTWVLQEMVDFQPDEDPVEAAVTELLQRQVTWH